MPPPIGYPNGSKWFPVRMEINTGGHYNHVTRDEVQKLVSSEIRLTMDLAMRLSRETGLSPEYYLNMQARVDAVRKKNTQQIAK